MDQWARALTFVTEHWLAGTARGLLRPGSAARYGQVFGAFCRYAETSGVGSPEAVSTVLCRRFIDAPLRGGVAPCSATSRLRLTVLRSAFTIMASAGAVSQNPTLDLKVRHTPGPRAPNPLTLPEATRVILAGRASPQDSLRPATTALALLGATHAEIARAVVDDLDEDAATLRLGGDGDSRRVHVPSALGALLAFRTADQRCAWRRRGWAWEPAEVPLALTRPVSNYPINSVAPTVSENLGRALRYAGVNRSGVRPKSVREYAANAVYARTQRIEAVAVHLGMSSLDTAARLIHPAWQERWGAAVRARVDDDG